LPHHLAVKFRRVSVECGFTTMAAQPMLATQIDAEDAGTSMSERKMTAGAVALGFAILIVGVTQSNAQTPPQVAPQTVPQTAPQAPPPPPYGAPITLDAAKQVMAGAEAEAEKNKWPVVIVILDSGGNIVMLHRRDDTQLSAIATAEGKARTALQFKRPTKMLDEVISSGGSGLRYLSLKDFVPLEGGVPIVLDGKIVGAIGVSGVLSSQDTQIARAGIDAMGK
jgi:glc operon protein GlcG